MKQASVTVTFFILAITACVYKEFHVESRVKTLIINTGALILVLIMAVMVESAMFLPLLGPIQEIGP